MPQRLLIVEDEIDIRRVLSHHLTRAGYDVTAVGRAEEGYQHILTALSARTPFDLFIFDLMLPDYSGLELCRQVRQHQGLKRIPVMFLTARAEEPDRIEGFESGADDYVAKPFSLRELTLRIQALLRRHASLQEDKNTCFKYGCLEVDEGAHRVFVHQQEVVLTALEFKLLCTLYARKGRVQSRGELLETVWNISADIDTRTVDTHIKRLREKIGDAGAYIETVRGAGYRFITANASA